MTTGDQEKIPLLVICGPTASGKTRLAIELGRHVPIEIISADSRQVYRWMNIGTAKATPEECAAVPHHVIDVVAPDEAFTAADFARLGRDAIQQIRQRGHLPVVVGGTGLYITALIHGLVDAPGEDPRLREQFVNDELAGGEGTLFRRLCHIDPPLAERLNPHDRVRIVRALEVFYLSGQRLSDLQERHAFQNSLFDAKIFGLSVERDDLYRRIDQRAASMFSDGLLDETEELLKRGFSCNLKSLQTIGYRESIRCLRNELTLAEAIKLTQQESRRYAKRQLTWFRKNNSIIWVDSATESVKIAQVAKRFHD